MIDKKRAIKYCKNDISMIENYDKAIADETQVWHCHHRRETIYSRSGLIEIGEYYNRPACELIFLTSLEHKRLHNLGKHLSEETRQKLSEAQKGENNPLFGKHHSAETRQKMSEAQKGKNHWTKGTNWYNNGETSILAKTCPEGFVKGRIVCTKRS